ncbi:MAG: tRNA pseudouridine(55) synthase TruB [Tissierellia bacterium]|nr:tRNA pseudouridine(55) synthase TruB [Tissierellia bacterium]
MNGIINVFKPKGMTSHDVIKEIRRIFNIKKAGHTGTLDPNAAGVLPVCIGKATRVSEYMLDLPKEYVGELTLGYATDTQDAEGKIIKFSNKEVKEDEIYQAFNRFKGEIEQIPPMYSALKYKGQKLYELARKGKTVERKARQATIYELDIKKILDKKIIFYVKCSRGTYIRTLCDDIGKVLGTYGYMSFLIRVGVGNFKIEDSISLDQLKELDRNTLQTVISSMDEGLIHLEKISLDKKYFNKLINGAKVSIDNSLISKYNINTPFRVYVDNNFIGIGRIIQSANNFNIKMDKVLTQR